MDPRTQSTYKKICILQIIMVVLTVAGIGILAPGPMIGDEVAHFYLLHNIAANLPDLTLTYHIPTAWSTVGLERFCNHSFLWHITGALIYRVIPHIFAIQLYQMLFVIQFIIVFFFFARDITRRDYFCVCWAMVLMWTMPMFLLFGTIFYKDIPVAAQIITAFYLLFRRKYVMSLLFWALALLLKETAVIMLPALLFYYIWRMRRVKIKMYVMVGSCLIVTALSFIIEGAILMEVLPERTPLIVEQLHKVMPWFDITSAAATASPETVEGGNCPGNLNVLNNWFIYPGIGLWIGFALALAGICRQAFRTPRLTPLDLRKIGSSYGVISLLIAMSYIIPATIALWPDNCDIRYYCPAIPFLIFWIAYWSADLIRKYRFMLPLLIAMLLAQTAAVSYKIIQLRTLSPELKEAIRFLKQQNTSPDNCRIFMYPEGNARFFPYEPIWTRGNLYFDIMTANNETKATLWKNNHVTFVVVKKYMESNQSPESTNFGSYPKKFVDDLHNDPMRFPVLFENRQIIIFGNDATKSK